MSLGFPLLVSLMNCFFLPYREGERRCVFALFFVPFLGRGILDPVLYDLLEQGTKHADEETLFFLAMDVVINV